MSPKNRRNRQKSPTPSIIESTNANAHDDLIKQLIEQNSKQQEAMNILQTQLSNLQLASSQIREEQVSKTQPNVVVNMPSLELLLPKFGDKEKENPWNFF